MTGTADEKWLAANPLAAYMERNRRDAAWIAERVGVSKGTVTGWLAGRFRPQSKPRPHGNGNDFVMLAQLIGGTAEDQWDAWLAKQPQEPVTAKEKEKDDGKG